MKPTSQGGERRGRSGGNLGKGSVRRARRNRGRRIRRRRRAGWLRLERRLVRLQELVSQKADILADMMTDGFHLN